MPQHHTILPVVLHDEQGKPTEIAPNQPLPELSDATVRELKRQRAIRTTASTPRPEPRAGKSKTLTRKPQRTGA